MNTLRPLISNVEDVRVHTGRYTVQLEIPKESTLSERDVRGILEVSSWERDPNTAEGFEGIRAVVLRREAPITKRGINLSGLQVSGIGHSTPRFSGRMPVIEGRFMPPSAENFMLSMPGTLMTTSRARNGGIVNRRPKYRAMGTYLAEELKEKLVKTREVSAIGFEAMAVPHIEAYGRYLDKDLSNGGQFGFIVTPVPAPGVERVASEFFNAYTGMMARAGGRAALMGFMYTAGSYVFPIGKALRELHDRARIAHLQAHLGNFYVINGIPYMVDWATMTHLDGSARDNIANRSIDLMRPSTDLAMAFSRIFRPNGSSNMVIGPAMTSLAMQAYSDDPGNEIDIMELYSRYSGMLRRDAKEADLMRLWMEKEGMN